MPVTNDMNPLYTACVLVLDVQARTVITTIEMWTAEICVGRKYRDFFRIFGIFSFYTFLEVG